jgi:hypothetical protein
MSEKTMNIILMSDELSKDDIQKLIQAIRDCEQKYFREKGLGVFLFVPTLTSEECSEILKSIQPPFAAQASWAFGRPKK